MSSVVDILAQAGKRDEQPTASQRGFWHNLGDNLIGYDDGIMTPGERLGAGVNELATNLWDDPAGTAGGILMGAKQDLDGLMFEGGAMQDPAAVLGYAAAPMAPGAANLMRNTPNVVNAVPLQGGGMSDPTQTGWTFRDVEGPIPLSRAENKWLSNGMKQPTQAEVPIRSLWATQDKVNDDFATTQTSAGERPLVVRKGGKFYIRDGHHRLTRIAEEGRQTAPVDLLDFDGTDTDTPLLKYNPEKVKREREEMDRLLDELGLLDELEGQQQ